MKNLLNLLLAVTLLSVSIPLMGQKVILSSKYYEADEVPKRTEEVFTDGSTIYAYYVGRTEIIKNGHYFHVYNDNENRDHGTVDLTEVGYLYCTPKVACFELVGTTPSANTIAILELFSNSKAALHDMFVYAGRPNGEKLVKSNFQIDFSKGNSKYQAMKVDFQDKLALDAPAPPRKGFSDPEVEKIVNEETLLYLKDMEGINAETIDGYFFTKEWHLEKNSYSGNVEYRLGGYIFKYRRDDGRCFYIDVTVKQVHETGGNYQRPFLVKLFAGRGQQYDIVQYSCE